MRIQRTLAALALGTSLALVGCAADPAEDELGQGEAALTDDDDLYAADFVPGQYIAVLRRGASSQALAERHGVARGLELAPQRAVVLKHVSDARLAHLAEDADVEAIYPDAVAWASGKPAPAPVAESVPAGVNRIGADEIANKGAGVVVCIVDTGIDYLHADLAGNYLGGQDFINNDADPRDDNGHGTHVAGTVAAVDNDTNVIGVAPEAKLLAAKVLNRRGSGSYSAITAGVNYCVAQGAEVINMSLGGSYNDPTLAAALAAAKAAGATIVVAAGNESKNLDLEGNARYPASYGTVITVSAAVVGATDLGADITWASFTNYGTAVDIAAPGMSVVSDKMGGGVTSKNGTSMASPHVAGAAALYIAANPGATPDQVEAALEAAAELVSNTSQHPEGFLNVRAF